MSILHKLEQLEQIVTGHQAPSGKPIVDVRPAIRPKRSMQHMDYLPLKPMVHIAGQQVAPIAPQPRRVTATRPQGIVINGRSYPGLTHQHATAFNLQPAVDPFGNPTGGYQL